MRPRSLESLIFLTLLLGLLLGCSDQPTKQVEVPIEQKLAIINAGHYIDESDITVKRFRYLLVSLQHSTGYEKMKIADMFAFAKRELRDKYGKDISLLELMEVANKSESLANKTMKLEQYLALLEVTVGR